MTRSPWVLLLALLGILAGCAGPKEAAGPPPLPATNYYEVTTPHGAFVVRLSDETPVHRDNFKKLVAEGFYDGTTFHRIVRGFMIQGGAPRSRFEEPDPAWADDGSGYTLPAEIVPGMTHTVGALAAARKGDAVNPERRSSGSQFYVVTGPNARHLDGQYTIFGRVVEGLDVLAELESVPTYRPQRGQQPAPGYRPDQPRRRIPMGIRPLPDYAEPEG